MKYADDIAVADYFLCQSEGNAVVTPGKMINWAIRMDPEDMDAHTRRLKGLYGAYGEFAVSEIHSPIGRFAEHWEGDGAVAFSDRFAELRSYVIGKDMYLGIAAYLDRQIDDMLKLATNTRQFQTELADLVEQYLAGLRKKYVKALTASKGGGSDTAIIATAADYGGVGTGLGAIGGPKGAAIGGAIGIFIGAIVGFLEGAEKSARENLHIGKEGDSFVTTSKELRTGLDVMNRERYSSSKVKPDKPEYGRSVYENAGADGKPDMDADLDEPWT